jgi:hypothetical protein
MINPKLLEFAAKMTFELGTELAIAEKAVKIARSQVSLFVPDIVREYINAGRFFKKRVRRSSGSYRQAFLTEFGVIKVSRSDFGDDDCDSSLSVETNFINRMRKTRFAKHFPETVLFTHKVDRSNVLTVQVQELIPRVNDPKMYPYHNSANALAGRLGISDMHESNYGWLGTKNNEYPVFIDVDFTYSVKLPKKTKIEVRDWMLF